MTYPTADDLANALNSSSAGQGAALVKFKPTGTGAVARSVQDKLDETISVYDFGAIGDGVANDTTAFADALVAAAAQNKSRVTAFGGSFLIDGDTITVPIGVTLDGGGHYRGGLGSKLIANSSGTMITCATGSTVSSLKGGGKVTGFGLQGIGDGTSTFSRGVLLQGLFAACTDCSFRTFNNAGLETESGSIACLVENNVASNCVMNRSVSSLTGALTVTGTDHYINCNQMGCGENVGWTISSASLLVCGIAFVTGSNCFVVSSSGENSDVGIRLDANSYYNRFTNCRGDNNSGHGWLNEGSDNTFAACSANNNSQAADNTYDQLKTTGFRNRVMGFLSFNDATHSTNLPKYSIEDTVAQSDPQTLNVYMNSNNRSFSTAEYACNGFAGSAATTLPLASRQTGDSGTLDATRCGLIVVAGTAAPTTITAITASGFSGQTVAIRVETTQPITLQQNSTIFLSPSGGTKLLMRNLIYRFTYYNGAWYEDALLTQQAGWTAGTGTALKGAFATYAKSYTSGTANPTTYTASELQGVMTALIANETATQNNSQRIKALEDAMRTAGMIN